MGNVISATPGVVWIPYNPSTHSIFIPSVTLPAQLNIIDENAFENCPFDVVRIPDGTSEIRAMAFANCHSLTQIYIPESVHTIDSTAFSGCESVIIIGVAGSDAEVFAQDNGIAFYKLSDMMVPGF